MLTYRDLIEGNMDDFEESDSQKTSAIMQEILAEEKKTDEYLESTLKELETDE